MIVNIQTSATDDNRFTAVIPDLDVEVTDAVEATAVAHAKAQALEVIADRIRNGSSENMIHFYEDSIDKPWKL